MKTNRSEDSSLQPAPDRLVRSLSLPLTVMFGLGVTIGAGIYVLIGATVGRAGMHAPLAFLLAALVMAPTAATFAEFGSRIPVSAAEAAYVEAGFRSQGLARVVGLMVISVGIVSAAAIAKGSAGYIREFLDLPAVVVVIMVVLLMGAVAAWGIVQSVLLASLMTLIELTGLVAIVFIGAIRRPDLLTRLPEITSGLGDSAAAAGIFSASLLAFFAFVGFEGLGNIAEEVKQPKRNLPRAIFLTLAVATVLYMLVVWIALISVPRDELAVASAPLSLVFQRVTGTSPVAISGIAIVATVNGVIALIVMASRVIYGLADRHLLPAVLARVNSHTRTPVNATVVVTGAVLILAIAFPLERLAETTSYLTLVIFAAVNAALVRLKQRGIAAPSGCFTVPLWVPMTGFVLCLALMFVSVLV